MRLQHYDDEYAVRDPAEHPTVRQTPEGDWIAKHADGRLARGSTPATAIASLKE